MNNDKQSKWKTIAIIFIILFAIETLYIAWGVYLYKSEIDNTNICYYDICNEYPEAFLEEGVCYCYDYDVLGEYTLVKTEILK